VAQIIDEVAPGSAALPSPTARLLLRRRALTAFYAALDAALILVGFVLAYHMRYTVRWPPPFESVVREVATGNYVPAEAFTPYAIGLAFGLLAMFAMKGLYRLPRSASVLDHIGIILSSTTTGIAVLIVVVFLHRTTAFYSRLIFAFAWITIVLLLSLMRVIVIWTQRWRWARGIGCERVLVVGGKGLGRSVMESIVAHPFLGYHLVGYLEDNEAPANGVRPNLHFHHLGHLIDLHATIASRRVQRVILALPFWEQDRLPQLVDICRATGVTFNVVPDLYHLSFDRAEADQLSGIPLIGLKTVSLRGWNLLVKRTMDLVLIAIGSPLVLLLGGLIALAIRRDSPGPIVFRQQRVGKGGKLFTTYKFRTMVVDAEQRKADISADEPIDDRLFKMRHDPRTTRLGRFLRRTSLDELPQLWNVVLGEMSLVGPRPQVPQEVAKYQDWHARRLEVTPGMTGLWQVLGRSDSTFDEMVRLDIYYAENWTPGMDIRILLQTLPAVLSGRGAY
jgi:exopolysaccharide biosynthesis polyprenyl glycosylphosphotransferase